MNAMPSTAQTAKKKGRGIGQGAQMRAGGEKSASCGGTFGRGEAATPSGWRGGKSCGALSRFAENVRAQVVSANLSACDLFDLQALTSRNRPRSIEPLMDRWRLQTQGAGERRDRFKLGCGSLDGGLRLHADHNKALPNHRQGIAYAVRRLASIGDA